ncbi:MAG: hypothetical protein AB1500_07155 [Bacillota bacterium]
MKKRHKAAKRSVWTRGGCGLPCLQDGGRNFISPRGSLLRKSEILLRNDRGQAALLAITLILLLVILTTASLTVTGFTKRASSTQLERAQAFYAAEAGINRALAVLQRDPMWSGSAKSEDDQVDGDEVEGAVADGVYIEQVEVEWDSVSATDVTVTIRSTGRYRGARKTLAAGATISYDPFMCGAGVTNRGGVHIYGDYDSLTIENDDCTIGDNNDPTNLIFAGGYPGTSSLNIVKSNGGANKVVVCGNVYTPQEVFLAIDNGTGHEEYVVRGDVFAESIINAIYIEDGGYHPWDLTLPERPVLETADYFRKIAKSYGSANYIDIEEHTFTDMSVLNGVYFVQGTATLSPCPNYGVRATIVAAGGVVFPDDCDFQARKGAVLGIISLSDITINGGNGNPRVDAVMLCRDTLRFADAARINGSVTTWGIGYGGDAEAHGHQRGKVSAYAFSPGGKPVKMIYDEALFKCYPPGMPYTVTVDSLANHNLAF